MRCRLVREQIDAETRNGVRWMDNLEIQAHLKECPACAKYARISGLLERSLTLAADDDSTNIPPLDDQRVALETRLAGQRGRNLPAAKKGWRRAFRTLRQPAVAASLAIAALALFTLVPFSYDRTVGYDLTMAGVSIDLAEDDEVLCDMLHRLGLIEAGVDVHSCDTTCSLSILDLKTQKEAHMVVGVIARLSESAVTTDIVPIRARTSSSLLAKAIWHGES